LGAARESRERDTSTSPVTQKRKINGWADLHDADVVHITLDRDVSGKTVSPWNRPDLGPWLADPSKFDVLVASKLDRVCRNAEDFFRLIRWAREHDVALVFVEEGFDLTTTAGEMAAKILAVVAEFEWNTTRARTLGGQQTAVQQGRWKGGIAPYGYRPVKEIRNGILGWYLVIDYETTKILHEVHGRLTGAGRETVTAICADLNERGVHSPADTHRVRSGKEPKGTRWRPANMIQLLRSRALLGEYQTADDSTLRDEETGLPISKADPVFTREEWAALQDALDRISRKKLQNRKGVSMLHDVAFCDVCERKLHHFQSGPRSYYRCSSYDAPEGRCENRMGRAEMLEEQISLSFATAFDGDLMARREIVPGEDYASDIAALDEEIANLAGNLAKVKPGSAAADVTLALLEDREARREQLAALPVVGDSIRYIPTGETMVEAWERLAPEERGTFLRDHDVTMRFRHLPGDDPWVSVVWGYLDQMKAALAAQ
jgi:site-specific DNA recombinase